MNTDYCQGPIRRPRYTYLAYPPVSLSSAGGVECLILARRADRSVEVWGSDLLYTGWNVITKTSIVEPPADGSDVVSAFLSGGCALWTFSNGSMGGSGYVDDFGVCPPRSGNNWYTMRMGKYAAAGIAWDGTMSTWGAYAEQPPPVPVAFVAVGADPVCALSLEGYPMCSRMNVPPPVVPLAMVALDSGGSLNAVACGIKLSDRTMICWGGGMSSWTSYAPTGRFVFVVSGSNFFCAVDWSQYVSCWGVVPALVTTFVSRLGRVYLPPTLPGRIPGLPVPYFGNGYGMDVCIAANAVSATPLVTATQTPTQTPSSTGTVTATKTATLSATASLTASQSPSPSYTISVLPTPTSTSTVRGVSRLPGYALAV